MEEVGKNLDVTADKGTGEKKRENNEGEEKSLLEKKRQPLELQETEDESAKTKSTSQCKWNLIQKIAIVVFLWFAYLLYTMAFSTIAPFFPIEESLYRIITPTYVL